MARALPCLSWLSGKCRAGLVVNVLFFLPPLRQKEKTEGSKFILDTTVFSLLDKEVLGCNEVWLSSLRLIINPPL